MPIIALELCANLLNVTDLEPVDVENFRWHFKVICGNCGEPPKNWLYVVISETMDMPGSRGKANLLIKCKLCERINTLNILNESNRPYSTDRNSQFQVILKMDCRGLELTAFEPRREWRARSTESSVVFDDIDLTDKEWADYDSIARVQTEISEIQVKFS